MIDYSKLFNEAMYAFVRGALYHASQHGLGDENYFYISFLTSAKNVKISPHLQKKYPKEMTIVLQHQFSDLIVYDEYFEVSLLFDTKMHHLSIPFASITAFADPNAQFALQLDEVNQSDSQNQFSNNITFENNKIKSSASDNNGIISIDELRKNMIHK